MELWGGVVVQAEPSKQTKDKTNNDLYLKEARIRTFTIGFLAATGALLLPSFFNSFSLISSSLLLTALSGAVVGYFLLAKEMGVTYAAIDTFCNAGKNANCDRVLDAEINLFGIKFSDAVATYFLFQVIALGFASVLPEVKTSFIQVLALLSVMTLPIILFSLYYQYVVAKIWCRLCLVVACLLAIQFCIFINGYFNGSFQLLTNLLPTPIIASGFLFVAIGFGVLLVKSLAERANELGKVEVNGNRLKHSVPVFMHLLRQQKRIDLRPFENEMKLGNPGAPIKIIMVSNLYCHPCKLKHEVIEHR